MTVTETDWIWGNEAKSEVDGEENAAPIEPGIAFDPTISAPSCTRREEH